MEELNRSDASSDEWTMEDTVQAIGNATQQFVDDK